VVNVCTAIATGVNADGQREILGVDVFTAEDGAAWTSFLRGLVARGLSGVRLVISDDHLGLKQAIAAVLPGAGWQRCRVHFLRNLLTRVPKATQTLVATLVRSIFAQPDQEAVWAQHQRMVEQLQERFPEAATLLAEAGPDVLAFASFPREHWRLARLINFALGPPPFPNPELRIREANSTDRGPSTCQDSGDV
jgi:transposase-like protein